MTATVNNGLVSARKASRELRIGRDAFRRYVEAGVFRGVPDPATGHPRYHIPTLIEQFAAAAKGTPS